MIAAVSRLDMAVAFIAIGGGVCGLLTLLLFSILKK